MILLEDEEKAEMRDIFPEDCLPLFCPQCKTERIALDDISCRICREADIRAQTAFLLLQAAQLGAT